MKASNTRIVVLSMGFLLASFNKVAAQNSAYIPFVLNGELAEVFQHQDSVFEIHEIKLYDSITNTLLLDNTGFVGFAKRTNDRIRIDRYVYTNDSTTVQFATCYLLLSDSCYEFIQVYDGSKIKVKTIEQIRRLSPSDQMGELFLGFLFGDSIKYLNEYVLLGDKIKSGDNTGAIYAMQRHAFTYQGILKRTEKGYVSTGKKLASTAITNCRK